MADSEQPPAPSVAERGGANRWTCQTCGAAASEAYCGACGERRLSSRDLGVVALPGQIFESVTNVDGRAFRTFHALLLQPGELTLAFLEGRRKQYIAPFQVFLIANVAFFFLQSLLGAHVLSNSFASHVENQAYSPRALAIATARLEKVGITREAYEPVFDSAVDVNAKALVVLFVPPCALLAWLISLGRGRAGAVHWVFALHFVAFLIPVIRVYRFAVFLITLYATT